MAAMFQAQKKEKETLKVSDSFSTTKHTEASTCKEMPIIKRYNIRYIECLSLDNSVQSILVLLHQFLHSIFV